MTIWINKYEEGATNAEIAAGGSNFEFFFSTNNAKQQISLNQSSFNTLELNNDSSNCVIDVDLDGLTTRRRRIAAKGNLSIAPEDGIFFNNVKVTNTSAANAIAAGELKINAAIKKPVFGS